MSEKIQFSPGVRGIGAQENLEYLRDMQDRARILQDLRLEYSMQRTYFQAMHDYHLYPKQELTEEEEMRWANELYQQGRSAGQAEAYQEMQHEVKSRTGKRDFKNMSAAESQDLLRALEKMLQKSSKKKRPPEES